MWSVGIAVVLALALLAGCKGKGGAGEAASVPEESKKQMEDMYAKGGAKTGQPTAGKSMPGAPMQKRPGMR